MTNRVDATRISDVRRVAKMLLSDEQVNDLAVGAARDSLNTMRDEAGEYGLTEADVVKAVLAPLFAKKPKGCDCYTCKERRGESLSDSSGGHNAKA